MTRRPSALAPRTLSDLRRRLELPVPTAPRVTGRGPRTVTREVWETGGLVLVELSCGHDHTVTRATLTAREGRVYCPACVRGER